MKKFDKVLNISFSVITEREDGATNSEIIYGIQRRLITLADDEIQEAVSEDSDRIECNKQEEISHRELLKECNDDRQELIDVVITQIQSDVFDADVTSIEGLLQHIPSQILKDYLPE